jgi:hypothetical protein
MDCWDDSIMVGLSVRAKYVVQLFIGKPCYGFENLRWN